MPETSPEFPQLLPPLGDELLADDALEAVAAQVPEVPDLAALPADSPEPQAYGKAWAWDFSTNRFKRAGHTPVPVWDLDNLKVWIQTVLNVMVGAHPVFDETVGVDEPYLPVSGLASDPEVQHNYMLQTHQALLMHDRITDVTAFDFWIDGNDTSVLYVDFEVHTDDGDVLPISLSVTE